MIRSDPPCRSDDGLLADRGLRRAQPPAAPHPSRGAHQGRYLPADRLFIQTSHLGLTITSVCPHRGLQHAAPAPYGRGADTIIDESVRRSFQIDASRITITNKVHRTPPPYLAILTPTLTLFPSLGRRGRPRWPRWWSGWRRTWAWHPRRSRPACTSCSSTGREGTSSSTETR